ncbi:response regulator [Piscinibacter sp.]|uniref:response regulator n=1 Tax=Piscinibacter sp. TaxID=1903157 RepID=UPI00355999F8
MTDPAPIKVLLIEDSPADARLIELMLADAPGLEFEFGWVDNLTHGIARLRSSPLDVDVVLLDLGLPESSGLDTLQRLLAHSSDVPTLVVLSGLTDEGIAVQALQSGAQDYLVKGQVDSALLVRAIRYAIGRSQA